MNEEVARFRRLRGAVEAASKSAQTSGGALDGQGPTQAFNTLQDEVRRAIPEGLYEEFDRLFPKMEEKRLSHDLLQGAAIASTARTKLHTLAGWLDGLIEASESPR